MAAAAPLRADLRSPVRPAARRPSLRLVPNRRRRRRRAWGDAVFATTLALVLGVGILGVLLLNTAMQTQADQISAAKHRLAALHLVVQGEQTELDRLNTPGSLAVRAAALHMRPAAALRVLRLPKRLPAALPAPAKAKGVSARARAKSAGHGG